MLAQLMQSQSVLVEQQQQLAAIRFFHQPHQQAAVEAVLMKGLQVAMAAQAVAVAVD
jgi:hypothetical protein